MAGDNKYWDSEEIVAEIPAGAFSKYVVSACKTGGNSFVNIREWYWTRGDLKVRPSKRGLCIPATESCTVMELARGMQEAYGKL